MKTGHQQILTKENFVESIINKGMDFEKNDISNIVNANVKAAAGIEISKLDSLVAGSAAGQITGNDTINRAIPHGLGGIPKMVIAVCNTDGGFSGLLIDTKINNFVSGNNQTVTTATATNFYVGASANYDQSFNGGGNVYDWVAIR